MIFGENMFFYNNILLSYICLYEIYIIYCYKLYFILVKENYFVYGRNKYIVLCEEWK